MSVCKNLMLYNYFLSVHNECLCKTEQDISYVQMWYLENQLVNRNSLEININK